MRRIFIGSCAAIALMASALGAASAGQFSAPTSNDSGAIIRIDDNRYYYGGRSYADRPYDNNGYGYSQDILSPRSNVRDLRQQGFSFISRPALAGQFYQVKARDPNGHKVKLFIDAYTGQIVKVEG